MFGFFSSKKNKLDPELEKIFKKIDAFLYDENTQNSIFPQLNAQRARVDEIVNPVGEFGRSIGNPIPTNGPVGSVLYLSLLRRADGMPFLFHRLGSKDGNDCYELLSLDGLTRENLWLNLYYLGKSTKCPKGFKIERKFDSNNFLYGTNVFVENFPNGVYKAVRDCIEGFIGKFPLPIYTVRAFCNEQFRKIDYDKLDPAYRSWLSTGKGASVSDAVAIEGTQRARVNHALASSGVELPVEINSTQFCIRASAATVRLIAQKASIPLDANDDDRFVAGVFSFVASNHQSRIIGAPFEMIASAVPLELFGIDYVDQVPDLADSYNRMAQGSRVFEAIGQNIAKWIANPTDAHLSSLASLYRLCREHA